MGDGLHVAVELDVFLNFGFDGVDELLIWRFFFKL